MARAAIAAALALAFALGLGGVCTSPYTPTAAGRIAVVCSGGQPHLLRDGKSHGLGSIFGDREAAAAVAGVPGAEAGVRDRGVEWLWSDARGAK